MAETYKDESRVNWHRSPSRPRGEDAVIKIGCLQRIADGVEKMASSYDRLRDDRDCYKRMYESAQAIIKRLARTNAALRGHLKRVKRGVRR